MIEGKSLRKSQKIVGVSYTTLFYWRHKILNALKQESIESFNGIVEMDETYLLFSEKVKKGLQIESLENEVVNLNLEALVKNKYVF